MYNLNLPLSNRSPLSWVSLYLQNSFKFSLYFNTCAQNPKHIYRLYSLKFVGQGNVESFFLTKHCFYSERYLQRATKGDQ